MTGLVALVFQGLVSQTPMIPITPDVTANATATTVTCDAVELLAAARGVVGFVGMSTDMHYSDLIYRTPSQSMREAADEMDRKDAAVKRFRAALDACKEAP